MADQVYLLDRVRVATVSGGTGALTIGAAPSGYLTPSQAGAQSGRRYTWLCETEDGVTWEVFEGVYTAGSPQTISRNRTIRNSSGGTSAVNFDAGSTKRITCVAVSDRLPYYDSDGKLPGAAIPRRVVLMGADWNGSVNLTTSDTAFVVVGLALDTKAFKITVQARLESGSATATTVSLTALLRDAGDTTTTATLDLGRAIVHSANSRYVTLTGQAQYGLPTGPNGQFLRFVAKIDQSVTPIAIYEYRVIVECFQES
ncbi:hypothetical protein [Roseomonas haemaphysalidis]|uniref:Minor tail protein n=1 Tax=Roseomonas haemaphysalidis TaxID=2768162 RepID=A0ABS3KKU6_9PROT|nr:hypothetical protein [Roseomonas haemaphysalidis]MBO1078098.1 hypothetical protein [Roseomonas haemaphysalidis]